MKRKISILLLIVCLSSTAATAETKAIPLPEIMKPELIRVDDTQLYITEGASIYIYSLKDFKLIKKFGSAGEGPREFKVDPSKLANLTLDVQSEDIVVHSLDKMSWFTKDGRFKKEIKLTVGVFYLVPFGKNFMGMFMTFDHKRFRGLKLFDRNSKLVKEIIRIPDVFQRGKGMHLLQNSFANPIYDNKLFLAWSSDFTIKVYDTGLKLLYTITHPYERINVPGDFKNETKNYYKKHPSTKDYFEILKPFKFSPLFPAVRDLFVSKGKIYAVTHKMENAKTELLVFDIKGKFLKQVFFPIVMETPMDPYPYTIHNGAVYQLVEDVDAEEWSLQVTPLAE
jgi:hypothetical protein